MPFIEKSKRELVDKDVRFAEAPGDLCYYFYKQFVVAWKEERRWTTAHTLYKDKLILLPCLEELKGTKWTNKDIITALHLAWQVFFTKKVMKYEDEKETENGDI